MGAFSDLRESDPDPPSFRSAHLTKHCFASRGKPTRTRFDGACRRTFQTCHSYLSEETDRGRTVSTPVCFVGIFPRARRTFALQAPFRRSANPCSAAARLRLFDGFQREARAERLVALGVIRLIGANLADVFVHIEAVSGDFDDADRDVRAMIRHALKVRQHV